MYEDDIKKMAGKKQNINPMWKVLKLRHTPSLLYPESCFDGIWRNHIRESIMRHLDLLQRFPFKITGWKNWIQKLLEGSEDSQQIQPKSKTQLSRTGGLVSEQPPWFAYQGDRKRYLAWLRKHKLKNGETCGCIVIQPELCASVCWTCR